MLKIKQKIDLKELEKFGFKDNGYNYYIKENKKYRIQVHIFSKEILVCKYRENKWFDYIGQLKEEENELKQYIKDLIQANLVEE